MARFEDRRDLLDALLEVHEERDLLQAFFERLPKGTLERVMKSEIADLDEVMDEEEASSLDPFGFDDSELANASF